MKKKFSLIVVAAMLFSMLLPFGSVFAYEGGLLEGKQPIAKASIYSSEGYATDGNLNSSTNIGAWGGFLRYSLDNVQDISKFFIKTTGTVDVNFYDSSNNQLSSINVDFLEGYKNVDVKSVKYIDVYLNRAGGVDIFEFDVFAEEATPTNDFSGGLLDGKAMIRANNVNFAGESIVEATDNNDTTRIGLGAQNQTNDTLYYKFDSPVNLHSYKLLGDPVTYYPYSLRFYDSSLNLINSFYASSQDGSKISISVDNVSYIAVVNTASNNRGVYEFNVYGGATPDPVIHDELSNLNITATHNSVSLVWDIPTNNNDFTGTKIYRNGVSLDSVNSVTKTFEDNDVLPGQSFTYKVAAVYSDGTETPGITKTVTTPELDSDGDGIPDSEDEYPEDPTNTPPPPIDSDGDGIPDSEDEFPNDPNNKPIIVGEEFEKQPNGDYLVKWSSPTTGTVKILIAGEEYAAAQASDKQFLIPASDVKYTNFGDPDVSLQPVSENGTIGDSVDNPKFLLNIPFTTKDVIAAGNALIWYVAPFLLLALAFILVPKLRKLVFSSFYKRKEEKETNRRFAAEEKIKQEKARQEKAETTFLEKERPLKDRYIPPITSRVPRESDRAFKMSRVPKEAKREFRESRAPRESVREPRTPRESFRPFREPRERRR